MEQGLTKVKMENPDLTMVTMGQQGSTKVMNGQLGSTKVKNGNKMYEGAKGETSGNKGEQWSTREIKR